MKRQRGVSLSGLMMGIALLVPVALLAMKVAPSVIEYYQILKAVKAVSKDGSVKGTSVGEVRVAFSKHQQVDNFTHVGANDIEVTKDGDNIVITFAYQDKLPLFANVSLMIEYEGSSLK